MTCLKLNCLIRFIFIILISPCNPWRTEPLSTSISAIKKTIRNLIEIWLKLLWKTLPHFAYRLVTEVTTVQPSFIIFTYSYLFYLFLLISYLIIFYIFSISTNKGENKLFYNYFIYSSSFHFQLNKFTAQFTLFTFSSSLQNGRQKKWPQHRRKERPWLCAKNENQRKNKQFVLYKYFS